MLIIALSPFKVLAQGVVADSLENYISPYERQNEPEKAATDYYMRGKEIYNKSRNIELASSLYQKAIKANPKHGAAHYSLAEILSPIQALPYSEQAVALEPNNYWYIMQLADIHARLRRFDKAVNEAKRLVELKPKDEATYRRLATYYYYGNQSDNAISVIDTIANKFGVSPEAALLHISIIQSSHIITDEMVNTVEEYAANYNYMPYFNHVLGLIYQRNYNTPKAIENFNIALSISPDEPSSATALFEIYQNMGKPEESVKYIKAIFNSNQIDIKRKIALFKSVIEGNASLYNSQVEHVKSAADALIAIYPNDFDVISLYTRHLLGLGDITKALSFNKEKVDSGVHNIEMLKVVIELLYYNKDYAGVIEYVDKTDELYPSKTSEFVKYGAFAYVEQKLYDEAISILKKQMKSVDDNELLGEYWAIIAEVNFMQKLSKKSCKAYEKSLKYSPNNAFVLNDYSQILAEDGRKLDKALVMSRRALDINPSNARFIGNYAWILFKLGRRGEARDMMSKAVALDTNKDELLLLRYGDILNETGNRELAEMYWRKSLESGMSVTEIEKRLE